MCPSKNIPFEGILKKVCSRKPPGIGKRLLAIMCSEVWLTSNELLMLYEFNVDEDVNPGTVKHMIWCMKAEGLIEAKEDPNGRMGPGGKSYLYRKIPSDTTS